MVEVFKTNVLDKLTAQLIVNQLYHLFAYTANFDLEDRDNILRVENEAGMIDSQAVVTFLKDQGFNAEVLPDEHILFPAK
jgi:hypothetical protein